MKLTGNAKGKKNMDETFPFIYKAGQARKVYFEQMKLN